MGEELEALQIRQPVRLLMIGGAYMITQIGNRATTMDIDVVAQIDPYSQEYLAFKNAVRFVASDEHINPAWLSDNISDFMVESKVIPARRLWLKHGMVEVYVPDPQYIFVLKVVASREKDLPDIQALMRYLHIKSRKQAEKLLKKYGDKKLLEDYTEGVNNMLSRLFSL